MSLWSWSYSATISSKCSILLFLSIVHQQIDPAALDVKRKIAFVAQNDTLFPTATPREAIRFAARLRMPISVTDTEIEILVDTILKELNLMKIADSMIGNGSDTMRGLSGGERRRVSLGIELVVRPSIVLLDEPTSGLDSKNASNVVKVCKKVANAGAAVIMVIHQPDSASLALTDHLILMHEGDFMYSGPTKSAPSYFAARGCYIPQYYNPALFMMEVSQGSNTFELKAKGFFCDFPEDKSLIVRASVENKHRLSIFEIVEGDQRVPWHIEFKMLMMRAVLSQARDKRSLLLRFGMTLTAGIMIAVFFQGVANGDSPDQFSSHVGALFMLSFSVSGKEDLTSHLLLALFAFTLTLCFLLAKRYFVSCQRRRS